MGTPYSGSSDRDGAAIPPDRPGTLDTEATMKRKPKTDKKQPATPKEATETTPGGLEVRTPSRDEFFGNLKKILKPGE